MTNLKIVNIGEIAIEALMLLGASSKEGDSSKIGFFGSGNKYAISTLLREGIALRIFSGTDEYIVSTKTVDFRDTQFEQIYINGTPTSLTTRTGPQWEVWMALREFICNAIDEGGYEQEVTEEEPHGVDGKTSIYVECTHSVQKVVDNMRSFVASDDDIIQTVATSFGEVSILKGTNGLVFRKGFRCFTFGGSSLYHYDMDDVPITEERICRWTGDMYARITEALSVCTTESVIKDYLDKAVGSDCLEGCISSYWMENYCQSPLSETWHTILMARKRTVVSQSYLSILPLEDVEATMIVVPSALAEKIQRDLPDVPVYGSKNNNELVECEAPNTVQTAVTSAIKELYDMGVVFPYEVVFCRFVCEATKAMVSRIEEKCFVDISILSCETELIIILYEEYLHTQGYNDCTRSMQNYLFKKQIELMRAVNKKDQ